MYLLVVRISAAAVSAAVAMPALQTAFLHEMERAYVVQLQLVDAATTALTACKRNRPLALSDFVDGLRGCRRLAHAAPLLTSGIHLVAQIADGVVAAPSLYRTMRQHWQPLAAATLLAALQ